MSRKQLQDIIRNLQKFYACPSCDAPYKSQDIKVLGQVDDYCFVQLSCPECLMPVMATIATNDPLVQAQKAMERDVAAREAKRFAKRGAISALEIAEFHEFISTSKGIPW